jgi:hypothetical protein
LLEDMVMTQRLTNECHTSSLPGKLNFIIAR